MERHQLLTYGLKLKHFTPLQGAAFIGCQRQAGEGVRLFALGDQPRARRGETGYAAWCGRVTANCRPAAPSTANKVLMVGLLFADRAR